MQRRKPLILIVGYGDLAHKTAELLRDVHVDVLGVKRQINPNSQSMQPDYIRLVSADVTVPSSLDFLQSLQPDIVLYCVAAGGQTDDEYRAAYVDGLHHILMTQQNNPDLKRIFFVSSTRVYGANTENLLDESIAPVPADFGGERLLQGEQLLQSSNLPATVLRLSGIYGPGRLRMVQLAQHPAAWPQHNTWSNRIHRDDAAAFIVFLIKRALMGEYVEGCYNVTDNMPVPQHEVLQWIAERLGSNVGTATPVQGGKRVSNKALQFSGFVLQYPDYRAGYASVIVNMNGHQS